MNSVVLFFLYCRCFLCFDFKWILRKSHPFSSSSYNYIIIISMIITNTISHDYSYNNNENNYNIICPFV